MSYTELGVCLKNLTCMHKIIVLCTYFHTQKVGLLHIMLGCIPLLRIIRAYHNPAQQRCKVGPKVTPNYSLSHLYNISLHWYFYFISCFTTLCCHCLESVIRLSERPNWPWCKVAWRHSRPSSSEGSQAGTRIRFSCWRNMSHLTVPKNLFLPSIPQLSQFHPFQKLGHSHSHTRNHVLAVPNQKLRVNRELINRMMESKVT